MEDRFFIVDSSDNVWADFETYEEAYDFMMENVPSALEPIVMDLEQYERFENNKKAEQGTAPEKIV